MKSIKPGRAPSIIQGIASIIITIFGTFWTIMTFHLGLGFFTLFGILFVTLGIIITIYNFKNATSKNRYSTFDITEKNEEIDPLNKHFVSTTNYCPYCGNKIEDNFEFCPKCGKKLPN